MGAGTAHRGKCMESGRGRTCCASQVHLGPPIKAAQHSDVLETSWHHPSLPREETPGNSLAGGGEGLAQQVGSRALGPQWCLVRKVRRKGTDGHSEVQDLSPPALRSH